MILYQLNNSVNMEMKKMNDKTKGYMNMVFIIVVAIIISFYIGTMTKNYECEYNEDNSIKKTEANKIINVSNQVIELWNSEHNVSYQLSNIRYFIIPTE